MTALLLAIGCATMHAEAPDPPSPPQAFQPEVQVAPPGSLWSEVAARQLMGMDGNARRVGDLITVLIADTSSTSLDADTSTQRSTSSDFRVDALLGLETSITAANPNMGGGITLGGGSESSSNGEGSTARNGTLAATVTCQVVEVLPNGNLRIRGTKQIRVNRETTYLALEGIIRPRDILLDNTVRSDLIAEAHIEFTGAGVIAKDQGAAWGTSVANTLWPF
jgi:flagellar L-ring protein precursor FlgH